MTGKHEAGTALQAGRGRSAFLSWCVCGWQGRAHQTDEDALHEAQAHVTERVREGFELLADLAQIPDTTRKEVHHEEAQGRQEEGRHEGQVGGGTCPDCGHPRPANMLCATCLTRPVAHPMDRGPITGGLIPPTTCPHCGGRF